MDTPGSVLCCKCGIRMQPNAANMCTNCLRTEYDITEGLTKYDTIIHCTNCDNYLQRPSTWTPLHLESRGLIGLCLKLLKGSTDVRLVEPRFLWTESNLNRVKLRVRVQKEVVKGALLEQAHVVEYELRGQMCDSCLRFEANPDQWEAVVQLRQHVSHEGTLLSLEQLVKKHGADKHAVWIKPVEQGGIDFFFDSRSHADNFVQFLRNVSPVCVGEGEQLVSRGPNSSNARFRCSYSVEISPICREDLICLPPAVAASLGELGPLVICNKVSHNIYLFDPFTLKKCFLTGNQYWASPFKALLSSNQLVKYVVLDVDMVSFQDNFGYYALAHARVARVSDSGTVFSVTTHLGHVLAPGDHALGYDLYRANLNGTDLDNYKSLDVPHVILIKKIYNKEKSENGRDTEEENSDYQVCLRDLEELSLCANDGPASDGGCHYSFLVDKFANLDINIVNFVRRQLDNRLGPSA